MVIILLQLLNEIIKLTEHNISFNHIKDRNIMKKLLILLTITTLALAFELSIHAMETNPSRYTIQMNNKSYRAMTMKEIVVIDNKQYIVRVIINDELFYTRAALDAETSSSNMEAFDFCDTAGNLVDQQPGRAAFALSEDQFLSIVNTNNRNPHGQPVVEEHTTEDPEHPVSVGSCILKHVPAILVTIGASTGMAVAATYAADWYNKDKEQNKKIDRRAAAAIAWISTAIACSSYFYCTATTEC